MSPFRKHHPEFTSHCLMGGHSGVLKRTNPSCLVLIFPLCLLLLTTCDKPAWPYPIKDSGFSAKDAGYHNPIAWLDEQRVLFEGHEGGNPRSVEAQQAVQWGLFIWDVKANTVEKYVVPARWVCYHDGYIHYVTEDQDGNPYIKEDAFGKEKDYPISRYYSAFRQRDNVKRNRYSCRLNERPKLMRGRGWGPLQEKDRKRRRNYFLI